MKLILVFCLFLLPLNDVEWLTDFDVAHRKAVLEHKLILLNFSGSDWCIPCRKLKQGLFSDADFVRYAHDSLVLINADFPLKEIAQEQKKKNEILASRYNQGGEFPLTLLLDTEAKVLMKWTGLIHVSTKEFINQIKQYPSLHAHRK